MANYYLDESFRRAYDVEFFDEYPSSTVPMLYVNGPTESRVNPIVRVTPDHGDSWTAVLPSPKGLALYTCPNPDHLLVGATVVRASQPLWTMAITWAHEATLPIPDLDLILVADNCNLHAWGADGPLWSVRDVAGDGIRKLRFADGFVFGDAWDPATQRWKAFVLDPSEKADAEPIWLRASPSQ